MVHIKPTKISDNVFWVGAIDWSLTEFHGYRTSHGTTYNAYLILADKITLIDTVKAQYKDEMLKRIAYLVSPDKIDFIISNHSELDHSGCLPDIIEIVQPRKVFASPTGCRTLNEHFHKGINAEPVEDGSTLNLGNMNLAFIETRMIHWPDSMFSYLVEDKLLFSQDGFGMHLASGERFADEIPLPLLENEAKKYFANILTPYADLIIKLLKKVEQLSVPIQIIAPDHGPVWRKDLDWIIGNYVKWSEQKATPKAVIVYDTMWGSTAKMASAIADGLIETGCLLKVMPLSSYHRTDIATEIIDAGALIVGSPTINNNVFPTIADILTYIKGLKPKNLIGTAFGSHGWSGEAVEQIMQILTSMKVEIASEPVKCRYVPDDEVLEKCRSTGNIIGQKLTSSVHDQAMLNLTLEH